MSHCHNNITMFIVCFSDAVISLIKNLILATDVAHHSDYLKRFQVITFGKKLLVDVSFNL